MVVQETEPYRIPGTEELAAMGIPYDECEITRQPSYGILPPCLVGRENEFRVCRLSAVSAGFKASNELATVVDASIGCNP